MKELSKEHVWEVDRTSSKLLKPLPWGGGRHECPDQHAGCGIGVQEVRILGTQAASWLFLTRSIHLLHSYLLTPQMHPTPQPPFFRKTLPAPSCTHASLARLVLLTPGS